jgi:hypothetical protein
VGDVAGKLLLHSDVVLSQFTIKNDILKTEQELKTIKKIIIPFHKFHWNDINVTTI